MSWTDWMIIIVAIVAIALSAWALYNSYHLSAENFA